MSWCPSWSNSLWQGWSGGLVHYPSGNATDLIWRVLASSDRISSWTQHSNPKPNPNPLASQLWSIDFLTPATPLIIPHRLRAFLESLMQLKNWCSIHARWSKSSLKHSICFCGIWPIDRSLSDATMLGQSSPGSNGNERVLHIPLSSKLETLLSDGLMSYQGLSLGVVGLISCRDVVSLFYSCSWLGWYWMELLALDSNTWNHLCVNKWDLVHLKIMLPINYSHTNHIYIYMCVCVRVCVCVCVYKQH